MRIPGQANRCAEFHHRLVKITRAAGIEQALCGRPRLRFRLQRACYAMHDSFHIAVEDCHWFRECDTSDCGGRVTAYAGQFAPLVCARRQDSGVLMHDSFRRDMKISCAAVVSQAAPGGEYRSLAGRSEFAHSGKTAKELLVVFHNSSDPRLLQHDF